MCGEFNTQERLTQLERAVGGLVQNAGLVGRHLEELYKLIGAQDEIMASLEDRLRRLFELMTPRFNVYFRDEGEACMAWELFKILRGTPDASFPRYVQRPDRPEPNFLSREIAEREGAA